MPQHIFDKLDLPISGSGGTSSVSFVNNPKSVAAQFSALVGYTKGQLVYYDNALYRFTADHAAGAWNSGHVTAVTVAGELKAAQEEVADLKEDINHTSLNSYENFVSIGAETTPPIENIYIRKSLNAGAIVDNNNDVLYYDLPIKAGYKIHMSDYANYKYFIKTYQDGSWENLFISWLTYDFTFKEDARASIYVQNSSGTALSDAQIVAIIDAFRIVNTNVEPYSDATDTLHTIDSRVGNSTFPSGMIYYQKILADADILPDNTKNILVYPIDVAVGDVIKLKDYATYKFCYKSYNGTSWGSASSWYTTDLEFDSAKRIAIYFRRNDGVDVTATDLAKAKTEILKNNSKSISSKVETLEGFVNKTFEYGTDFENRFVPSNLLELPSEFSGFPIPIKISRSEGVYGHNLNPHNYTKNNANGVTYYVSNDGSDSNTGKSPSTSLKTITEALSKADVNTIIISAGEYVNGTDFNNTAITANINIIGVGNVVLKSSSAQNPMKFTAGCYIENIIFDGGVSACETELTTDLCVFNKCAFVNSGSLNGLTAKGGKYILFECIADNNMLDGFNYHSYNSNKPKAVEICCKGRLNGNRSTQTINNGSTCHEYNSRIIRIGCEYSSCRGGVVADAECMSINIAVKAFSTEAVDATNRNGNFVAIANNTKMWLYGCQSFGSPYDLIADAGTIYTTETYARESTVNSGSISRLS